MFVLRSTHAALKARYEQVLHQRDIARRDAAAHLGAAGLTAGQVIVAEDVAAMWQHTMSAAIRRNVRLGDRLERMVRATARLRTENAQLHRDLMKVWAAYDNAVGLDSPALDLGAHWQERRSDKPRAKAVES
ncbi:hypothetical protein [Streptomyces sp. LN549]|uniref:hypothetical protein n=1 Tax=Streptomyces sp. LN549 TaxID=3112979 RepID=UPI00371CCB88